MKQFWLEWMRKTFGLRYWWNLQKYLRLIGLKK